MQRKMVLSLTLVILLGIFFQVLFVFADTQDSPQKAALAYTKALLGFDRDVMAERVCEESLVVDEINVVNQYIHEARKEARARGYDLGMYTREKLYHGDTETMSQTYDKAIVKVTGETKSPLRSFFWKGEDEGRHIDITYKMVKEDGRWKVCENPLALARH